MLKLQLQTRRRGRRRIDFRKCALAAAFLAAVIVAAVEATGGPSAQANAGPSLQPAREIQRTQ